jgi:hypothetical protein
VKFKEKNFVYEDLIGEFPGFTNDDDIEEVYMAIFDDSKVFLYGRK